MECLLSGLDATVNETGGWLFPTCDFQDLQDRVLMSGISVAAVAVAAARGSDLVV